MALGAPWTDGGGFTARTIRGVLTAAQLNNLFTAPVTFIPDQAGKWIIYHYLLYKKEAGNAFTLNGSSGVQLQFTDGGVIAQIAGAGVFDTGSEIKGIFYGPQSVSATLFGSLNSAFGPGQVTGKGLRLACPTANFSGGTSRLLFKLYYYEFNDGLFENF